MMILLGILLFTGYAAFCCYLEVQDQKNWREFELTEGRKALAQFKL